MSIIRGYDGTVTVSGIEMRFVSNWEINYETEETEKGPFIGDGGRTYSVTTTRRLSGSIEAVVPKNKDTGQGVIITAAQNGGPFSIVLATTLGYTITIPSGIVLGFTMGQEAADTVNLSFDFRDSNGMFTIT
jgi:hypothetical protein